MKLSKVALAAAVATAVSVPSAVLAESNFTVNNVANITATARVNFLVVIPKFVALQVGTGAPFVTDTTIDTVTFSPALGAVGDGNAVAGTGGNLGGGAVDVRVVGNNGNMTLGAVSGNPNLVTVSGGETIPWSEITVTTAGGTAHPLINGGTVTYNAVGRIVNATGTWTYSYENNLTVPSGDYTGQVTYTATTP